MTARPTPSSALGTLRGNNVHPMARPLGPPALGKQLSSNRDPVQCGRERCQGAVPAAKQLAYSLGFTGKHTRGSNSQLSIPQNLLLADIDADGMSDFVQYSSNKLFVSHTDYEKTGLLHLYMGRPIKRILTGDFHGDHYDQTCIITDDNALACFATSPDRTALWWWYTQGSFVGDNEDAIVADYDGDGRDDVLVVPRDGGDYRMYSVKGDFFFDATPAFAPGNLGTAEAGLQVRAGDFNADGRDDLMLVNQWGQIIYHTSVFDGTNNTFWWAFTTNGGFVGPNDQVTVARIDDDAADDIVLHDTSSGSTRFHYMDFGDGSPPAIPVSTGQIDTSGGTLLFWGYEHGALSEPGAYNRDDAMIYYPAWGFFVRSDARWDGSAPTYWWAYSQYAPNNDTGWAPLASLPYLVLKCKFSDVDTEPQSDQFYRNLIFSGTGLAQYWRDVSYGSWDLSGTNVVDGWSRMGISNADWAGPNVSRYDRSGLCINAYGGSTDGYVNAITIVNGEGDAGNAGGRVLVTPSSSVVTFLGHETGHTFGWGHSYDDTDRKNSDWSAPGEYFDFWDIMSAMAVYDFADPDAGLAGPEMNAPFKTMAAFIPPQRIARLNPGGGAQQWRSTIAAINRPEGNGALMVRIGADDSNYYTIEYRMPSGWDQAIPQRAVLVHRVTNGTPYLITAGGTERLVGSVSAFDLAGSPLTVTVNGFADAGFTADVTVDY